MAGASGERLAADRRGHGMRVTPSFTAPCYTYGAFVIHQLHEEALAVAQLRSLQAERSTRGNS